MFFWNAFKRRQDFTDASPASLWRIMTRENFSGESRNACDTNRPLMSWTSLICRLLLSASGCCHEPATLGWIHLSFTICYIPQSHVASAGSLCLILLSPRLPSPVSSSFFFWFPLWNVTFGDLDRPSWGFCTLGGISIGPWGLFIRDSPFL